jgi:membrane-bound lytic murein transglycosylase D
MKIYFLLSIISLWLLGYDCAKAQASDNGDRISVINNDGRQDTIDVPEAMTTTIDSLMEHYMAKAYLYEDNNCVTSDVNPTFPKEVYIDRLSRMPTVIEMPYNDVVQQLIDRYTGKLRRSVSYMLGASNFYMPIFEEALEAYGLPLELKYLPVIESALNPVAVSRAKATGLWQFMLATGKQYGLEVNSLVDERCDPIKSSYAAAHFLSDLYKIFGDWHLVIAAYNCVPENVNKAIRRSNGSKDYWQIYPYLPRETRGYVPAFIAANYVMTYYCEHNICPLRTQLPVYTDTIVVDQNVHFEQIAAYCGIATEHIKSLNPSYRRDVVPGLTKPSTIRLPQSYIGKFIDNEDSIYTYKKEELLPKRAVVAVNDKAAGYSAGSQYIRVRQGQTLGGIARKYGTTVSKLRRLNGLRNNNIRAGKRLRIR